MYRKYGVFDTDIESSRQMADDSDRLNFFMSRLNESMIKAGYISNPEESVRVFLKRLRDLFRADRTYVCELNPFGVYDNTFESRAPGISTDQEALRQIVNMAVSELGENLSHGRGFMIADMDEFRSANPRLYGMISGNGLKRTVICPLMNESRLLGVIGIDNPSKENMDVCTALFQMSADYVSMKLCRGAGTVKNDSSDRRDQITGLYSSNVFQNSLTAFAEKLAEVEVEGKWDIVCFNIRQFTVFNNQYGYSAGNNLLKDLGARICRTVQSDHVMRLNADNFFALIRDDQAEDAIERIHDAMRNNYHSGVLIYAGIYTIQKGDTVSGRIVDRAKMAANHASRDFRNYYRRFTPDMEENLKRSAYLVAHVDEAIEKGWIRVYYQPIVNTLTHMVTTAEALSRWDDPQYGMLQPDQFISTLEEARLLYRVDLYVIDQACRVIEKARNAGKEYSQITINLSRHDLEIGGLHEMINATLARHGVPREDIHLEITETALISNEEAIRSHLERFHQDGYEVWLDDFGSGYSSLNTLQNYNFDCVKVDMMFLRRKNNRTPMMLKSIVDLAKKLNMITLTEGVETEEEYKFLRSIGCNMAQGFLSSKPDALEKILTDERLRDMGIETPEDRIFYRQVGRVNFLDSTNPMEEDGAEEELPLALLEIREGENHLLYQNEAFSEYYKETMRELSGDAKWKAFLRPLIQVEERAERTGRTAVYDFVEEGTVGRITLRFIARYRGRKAFLVKVMNIDAFRDTALARLRTIGDVYAMFDSVEELVPSEHSFYHIYGELEDAQAYESAKLEDSLRLYVENRVHPDDWERYLEFIDPKTLKERVDAAPNRSLNSFFYYKNANGSCQWKRAMVIPAAHDREGRRFLLCICGNLTGWDPRLIDHHQDQVQITPAGITAVESSRYLGENRLWKALMSQDQIGFSWKDRDLKYAGANETILRYYHWTMDDIIGRSDEELGRQRDPERVRRQEERVIREGAAIPMTPAESVVGGQIRHIMVSKYPIYTGDEITGLLEYFTDVSETADRMEKEMSVQKVDPVTGLMNEHALHDFRSQMQKNYMECQDSFACIVIQILGLHSYWQNYGRDMTEQLLKKVGSTIRDIIGDRGTAGHPFTGRFSIYVRCGSGEELKEITQRLGHAVTSIHVLEDSTPVTVYAMIGSCLRSTYLNVEEMITLAESRMIPYVDTPGQSVSELRGNGTDLPQRMKILARTFDVVRVVDPYDMTIYEVDQSGYLLNTTQHCYEVWGKKGRCVNCTSARAIAERHVMNKFENIGDKVYLVISEPLVYRGTDCVLECAYQLDDMMVSTVESSSIGGRIRHINSQLFKDSLTGAYNRRYYDEIAKGLYCSGMALYDLDNFKKCNDTYGHEAGDLVLRRVTEKVLSSIRSSDALIRYGGDEFILSFHGIPDGRTLKRKLEKIRKAVSELQFQELQGFRINISIGGVFAREPMENIFREVDDAMYEAKKKQCGVIVRELE